MTLDPIQLYEWVAKVGFPGSMAVFIWALYTRRLHWHTEFTEMKEQMALEYSRMKDYLEDRAKELLGERDEFKEMVITSQRTAAKSMDTLSLAIEKTKKDT
jgi:hypothetical protein